METTFPPWQPNSVTSTSCCKLNADEHPAQVGHVLPWLLGHGLRARAVLYGCKRNEGGMERSLLRSETLHRKVREIQAASSFPKPKKNEAADASQQTTHISWRCERDLGIYTNKCRRQKPYSGITVRLMVTSSGWGSPPARRPTTYLLSSAS